MQALQHDLHTEATHRRNAEQLCNAKMEEARVLAADLGTMTRENQVGACRYLKRARFAAEGFLRKGPVKSEKSDRERHP